MYKKDVIKLYKELSELHNCDYGFKFDNAKNRCGLCNYKKETISLSNNYVKFNSDKSIKNTILHEIAHALTKSGHDYKWKRKFREIGGNGNRINKEAIVKYKLTGYCPNCNEEHQCHRRTRVACSVCCTKYNNGRFIDKYLIKYRENI